MLERTDSFCERCGSRYMFSPPPPKTLSLKGARVLARGLKNFVLNDGQSMNDSMLLARHEDEREATGQMTEAFYRTFNFCMTCRQYACAKCWNARQGACLTCAPEPGFGPVAREDHLIARTPLAPHDTDWDLFPEILGTASQPAPEAYPVPEPAAWPTRDLEVAPSEKAGGRHKGGRDNVIRKPVDQEAWSLWPLADELAPEMTLTPEELMLVEAELTPSEPVPETPLDKRVLPQPMPQLNEVDAWLLRSDPSGDTTAPADGAPQPPERPSGRKNPPHRDHAATPVDTEVPGVVMPPVPPASPVLPPVLPPVPPASPVLPTGTPAAGHEVHSGAARLLRRLNPSADAGTPGRRANQPSRRGQPSGDPWPHVTSWSERPIKPKDWQIESGAVTPAGTEPVAASLDVSADPELPRQVVAPTASSAAARRKPASAPGQAVEPESLPMPSPAEQPSLLAAAQQALFEAPPAPDDTESGRGSEIVPWTGPDQQVAAVRRKPSPGRSAPKPIVQAQPPAPQDEPADPTPWPPLGASWPASEAQGAPWLVTEAPVVPAAMVVKAPAAPLTAELWAQSAQEVMNRGTVRVCHHCALPVSTQARYCRRCGTKQA